jgi:hypothetical protein
MNAEELWLSSRGWQREGGLWCRPEYQGGVPVPRSEALRAEQRHQRLAPVARAAESAMYMGDDGQLHGVDR